MGVCDIKDDVERMAEKLCENTDDLKLDIRSDWLANGGCFLRLARGQSAIGPNPEIPSHSIHRLHGLFIEHGLNLREHRVGLLEGRRKPPRATGAELDTHIVDLAP